jgi:hypothetical protein
MHPTIPPTNPTNQPTPRTLLYLTSRAGKEDYAREMVAGAPTLLDLLDRCVGCFFSSLW